MSLQYSGGTLVNTTFTPATRGAWVNAVTQALSDAGWTTISGTPGSGADVKMETAANNNGAKIRFRIFDPAANNCAQVTMKNVAESVTSQIAFKLPTAGSGQWRIVANKYHFFAFPTGAANVTAARGAIFGGTLYTPTFWSPPTDSIGLMQFGGINDTDSGTNFGWRRQLRHVGTGNEAAFSTIQGSTLIEKANADLGAPGISVWQGGANTEDSGYRWTDDTWPIYEPLVAWSSVANTGEAKIKGQLYDALVMNVSGATSESTFTFDGKTWMIITDAPTGAQSQTAVLCLAVA